MRKCLRCKVDLKQKEYKSVMVDECQKCGGIWFDRDELRKAKDNTDDNLRWLDYDPFTTNNNPVTTNLSCPDCNKMRLPAASCEVSLCYRRPSNIVSWSLCS